MYKVAKGNSAPGDHIKRVHKKWVDSKGEIVDFVPGISRGNTPIDFDAYQPRDQAIMNALASTFDEGTFRRLLT
jgi:hypothetical protein